MENKKELLLTLTQLLALIIGSLAAMAISYPEGILFLLPLGAAPISQIIKMKKKHI